MKGKNYIERIIEEIINSYDDSKLFSELDNIIEIDFVDIFNAIIEEDRLTAKKLIDSEIKNITECSTAISMAIIKEIKLHKRVPSQATIDNIVREKEKQNDLNYSNG